MRTCVMSDFSSSFSASRRRFLGAAAFGIGALAGLESARSATGRTTDLVRLTWGLSGLNLVAKERGEFEKRLACEESKGGWVGPLPEPRTPHAGRWRRQRRFQLRRQHDAGAGGPHCRFTSGFHPVRRLR